MTDEMYGPALVRDDELTNELRAIVAPTRPRNVLNTYGAEIGVTTAVVDYLRPRDFDIVRP